MREYTTWMPNKALKIRADFRADFDIENAVR